MTPSVSETRAQLDRLREIGLRGGQLTIESWDIEHLWPVSQRQFREVAWHARCARAIEWL
jgi:hypothetical protein